MAKRIVIVGGVAAGASAAAKARRTSEDVEIVMIEAGPYVSFANCGLPYYLGGEIGNRRDLFVSDARQFADRFKVDVRVNTTVTGVAARARTVTAGGAGRSSTLRRLRPEGGRETIAYDRLILATGTVPIAPPIEGLDSPDVFLCRTVPDADAIAARCSRLLSAEGAAPNALVIGGGYVGLECAEQLLRRGFRVTVVELADQLMLPLDAEMAQPLEAALAAGGAEVVLGDAVARIRPRQAGGNVAVLASGREAPFDLAIAGLGVRPNVELAEQAGLRLGPTGAIAVNEHQRTSDPAIFAAGDNCESLLLPTGSPVNIPLAGPANRQGRVAGMNAALDLADPPASEEGRLTFAGVLGTAVIRVCGAVAGITGLSEKLARRLRVRAAAAYVFGPSHAGYYPGAEEMLIKLLYDPEGGRLLGAQAVGGQGVDKRIDVFAAAIHGGLAVEDLEQLDLCYAPPFGSAKDVAVLAGFVAANALRGTAPAVTPQQLLAELAGQDPPLVVDVRTGEEFSRGHLPNAVNIPLSEIRRRLGELPMDRPVVVHCGVGYRSYLAQRILLNRRCTNVRNLLGGYKLISRIIAPRPETLK